MQAVIFIGIQATGKSTFFKENFFQSHVRVNLDMLKTRNREQKFTETCLQLKQRFVSDNTNPSKANRKQLIKQAKIAGFEVIGYYFESRVKDSLIRNAQREGKAKIPEKGILNCYSRLEQPSYHEGFDQLFYVRIVDNSFEISEWKDEI